MEARIYELTYFYPAVLLDALLALKTLPLFLIACLLTACKSGSGFNKDPVGGRLTAKTESRLIRTTAYCHLEDGIRRNAIGGALVSATTHSASADWSRYPAGTIFRVVETGKTYVIDDYGPALVGTNTIDLYVPTLREMRNWGTRTVHIQILKRGSAASSLSILRPRAGRGYIRRMVRDLETEVR